MHILEASVLAALLMTGPVGASSTDARAVQDAPPGDTAGVDHRPLTPLGTDLDPLRRRFNEGKGKRRFLALLSPT